MISTLTISRNVTEKLQWHKYTFLMNNLLFVEVGNLNMPQYFEVHAPRPYAANKGYADATNPKICTSI